MPSTEALALLVEGLALVYGEPFDDVGYEWAIDQQLPFRAAKAIEAAALRAVELALAADDVVTARDGGGAGVDRVAGQRAAVPGPDADRGTMPATGPGSVRCTPSWCRCWQDLGGDAADGGDPSPATTSCSSS